MIKSGMESIQSGLFQNQLDAIFKTTRDGIALLDYETNFIDFNPAYLAMTGFSRDELLQKSCIGLSAPEDISRSVMVIKKVLEEGYVDFYEKTCVVKDDRHVYVHMSLALLPQTRQILIATRDMTQFRDQQTALMKSKQQFESLLEFSPIPALISDFEGNVYKLNHAFIRLFGYSREDIPDIESWWQRACPDSAYRNGLKQQWDEVLASKLKTFTPIEARVSCMDRSVRIIRFHLGISDTLIVTQCEDITEIRKLETSMRLSQNVFENASEGILVTDSATRIISVNSSFEQITGYHRNEILGNPPNVLKSNRHDKEFYTKLWETLLREGHWQGEIWNRKKSGEIYIQRQSINIVRDAQGRITNFVSVFQDISELKLKEEQIVHMAYHDALTGLPNRLLLTDRISRNIERAKRHHARFAVLFLDLDRFKQINDTLGHNVGDDLLQIIAKRLSLICRAEDTLSRLGGDEFIILIDQFESDEQLLKILSRLLNVVREPAIIEEHHLTVSTSIGIAIYPEDGVTADILIKNADAAMYESKKSGKNSYSFFNPALNENLFAQLELEMKLHEALKKGEFELFAQPKVTLSNHQVCGAELLIRWKHDDAYIYPSDFIPVAEESGLIVAIGSWVMEESFRLLQHYRNMDLSLSINVSAKQFQQEDIVAQLQYFSAKYNVAPRMIQIELTESAFIGNPQTARTTLNAIRTLGFSIALDDFGTGFSSLSYLKQLPIDIIKIDQSFIRDMTTDSEDKVLVESIIAMAGALNKKTVAEGVETREHLEMLQELGCYGAQGYYFARPMPFREFIAWLKNYSAD